MLAGLMIVGSMADSPLLASAASTGESSAIKTETVSDRQTVAENEDAASVDGNSSEESTSLSSESDSSEQLTTEYISSEETEATAVSADPAAGESDTAYAGDSAETTSSDSEDTEDYSDYITVESSEVTLTNSDTIDYLSEEDVAIETTDVPMQTIEVEDTEDKGISLQSTTASEYHILLVLDVSGSMSGTPMTQMKKACNNFIDDILTQEPDAGIGIVTFASNVTDYTFSGSYFTSNRSSLRSVISGLSASGGTAMNAGLKKADEILQSEGASQNIIIQMADGLANEGSSYTSSNARYYGTSYVDPYGNAFTYSSSTRGYCSEVYNTYSAISGLYNIYALGFFHSMSGTDKQFAEVFMNDVQNQASFYEVVNADDLSFSFESIAEDINADYLHMSKDALTLEQGDSEQLDVSFDADYPSSDKMVTWGSSDSSIASVDSSGNVTALAEGSCTITAEAGGYKTTATVTVTAKAAKVATFSVSVKKNTKAPEEDAEYTFANGATITYDGVDYTTGAYGYVMIPEVDTEIQVSLAGYSTKTVTAEQLEESNVIYLEQISENPVINAVWIGSTDALREEVSIDIMKTSSTVLSVDVDWGNSSYGSVKLMQGAGDSLVEESFSGNSLSCVLKDKFDVSSELYVCATNAAGRSIKKKLKIVADSNILNGAGLEIAGSLKITIPSKVPLLGGNNLELDLKKLEKTEMVPFNCSYEDGKVYVSIGVDMAGYSKSQKGKKSESESKGVIPALVKKLKNVKEKAKKKDDSAWDQLKDIKNTYKKYMKKSPVKFGFDADCQVLGFIEGTLDDQGKLQILDSGIIVAPSIGVKWDGQFSVGPVPCYWEAAISGELKAQFNLYANPNAGFVPYGSAELSITGKLGGGLGINKVATVGGGGQANFTPKYVLTQQKKNELTAKIKLNAYFKVQLACLVYTWEPEGLSKTWNIPDSGATTASLDEDDIYDLNQYRLEDLTYLLRTDSSGICLMSADEEDSYAQTVSSFHENSYSLTDPQIVALAENTKLAVWVDYYAQEGQTSIDNNDIHLYYSYYDGSQWSDPAMIEDDGTMDYSPAVAVVNKKAYVIWQDADAQINAEDSADKIAGKMGITAAVFNPASETFTVTALAQNTGYVDTLPQIGGEGDTVVAAWVENTDNNWYGQGNHNNIMTAACQSGSWSDATAYQSGLTAVSGLAADYHAGSQIAYILELDKSLSSATEEDASETEISGLELYVNGKQLTDDTVLDSAPSFVDHILYWYSDGGIKANESLKAEDTVSILGTDVTIESDDYQVVTDGKKKAIIYPSVYQSEDGSSDKDGIANTLNAVYYNSASDSWGSPICMTDGSDYIQGFSAIWEDDDLLLLYDSKEVTGKLEDDMEDPYGSASLLLKTYENRYAVTVDDCLYNPEDIVAGGLLPVTLQVTNSGMAKIDGITVTFRDASGAEISHVNLAQTILSGQDAEFELNYQIRQADIGKKITVECNPMNQTATSTDDNKAVIEASYSNMKINQICWAMNEDGSAKIVAQVYNDGYTSFDNVIVNLYKESPDTENLKSVKINGSFVSMDQQMVSFDVPYEEGASYYVQIQPQDEEYNIGDNADYVTFAYQSTDESRTLTDVEVEKTKTVYNQGDTLTLGDLKVTGSYSDGSKSDLTRSTATSIDVSKVLMSVAGSYNITVTYKDSSKTYSKTIAITVNAVSGSNSSTSATSAGTAAARTGMIGKKITSGTYVYKVLTANTVQLLQASKKTIKTATVASTIKYGGVTYKVTSIAASAFSGYSKLTKVTIGKNVSSIGAKAFYNCKKLKTVTIQSAVIKSMGSKAFNKIYSKAAIKVPAAKKKAYKKLLKKAGVPKTYKLK